LNHIHHTITHPADSNGTSTPDERMLSVRMLRYCVDEEKEPCA